MEIQVIQELMDELEQLESDLRFLAEKTFTTWIHLNVMRMKTNYKSKIKEYKKDVRIQSR